MYPNKTIELSKFMINIGFKLQLFPFKLITSKNGIAKLQLQKSKKQKQIWDIIIVGYALLQVTFILLAIWYDLTSNTPIAERALGFAIVPAFLAGIIFSFLTFLHCETCVEMFNTFIVFCKRLPKYKFMHVF